jgi:hypothetical protein
MWHWYTERPHRLSRETLRTENWQRDQGQIFTVQQSVPMAIFRLKLSLATLRFEQFKGRSASAQSGRPTRIKGHLYYQSAQLVERNAVVDATAHPVLEFLELATCGEYSAGDKNPIAIRHFGLLPDISDQDFFAQSRELRHMLIDTGGIASGLRCH